MPEPPIEDLRPHEWQSSDNRPKQREPVFGGGVWIFVFSMIVVFAIIGLKIYLRGELEFLGW